MALTIKCPLCGEVLDGHDEDALVAAANAHGDEKHGGMRAPRSLILGNARPSE